ncbi:MAG TPA: peptidylprolyl isomerase [Steroidobacteraceae bacterium]|nr:peptidylprolyl isomerase [Steroidobacteraceae bacterium]
MNIRNVSVSRAGLVLAGLVLMAGCGGEEADVPQLVVPTDADPGAAQRPQVTMVVTNGAGVSGTIVITLVPEHAPQTVANFLSYVNNGFYVNTVFHRYQANFVLQGGGFASPVNTTDIPDHKAAGAAIPLEVKVSNVLGTVAMARTSNPNSATTDFFINLANNTFLNTNSGGYAAFGYITDMSPVSALIQAPCQTAAVTGNGQLGCLPDPNLVITSATKTR